MDDKTLNGLSASLTLLQIQLNAVLSLLQAQYPTVLMRDLFCGRSRREWSSSGHRPWNSFGPTAARHRVSKPMDMGLDDLWIPGEVQQTSRSSHSNCLLPRFLMNFLLRALTPIP
jgi:hypothetical protein